MLQKPNGEFYKIAYRVDYGESASHVGDDMYKTTLRNAESAARDYVRKIGGNTAWANIRKIDYVNNRETEAGGYRVKNGLPIKI